jgi:hypothetical protein
MTGPEPTMDELVELGIDAYCRARGWDDPAAVTSGFREECARRTRSILTAVLPRVLEGAREECALVALEQRCERGTPWDLACTTIAAAIRARSVLSHIDSLLKGET